MQELLQQQQQQQRNQQQQQQLLLLNELQQVAGQQLLRNSSLNACSRHLGAPGASGRCNQTLLASYISLQRGVKRPSALNHKPPSQYSSSLTTAGRVIAEPQYAADCIRTIKRLLSSIVDTHQQMSGQPTQLQQANPAEQQHWQLTEEQLPQLQEIQKEKMPLLLKGLQDMIATPAGWEAAGRVPAVATTTDCSTATTEWQQMPTADTPSSHTLPATRPGWQPSWKSAQSASAGCCGLPDMQALSATGRPQQLLLNHKDLSTPAGTAAISALDASAPVAAGISASGGVIPHHAPVNTAAAAAAAVPDRCGRNLLSLSQLVSSGTATEAPAVVDEPQRPSTTNAHLLQILLDQIKQLPPLSAVIKKEHAAAAALQAKDAEQAAPADRPAGKAAEDGFARPESGLLEAVLCQPGAGLKYASEERMPWQGPGAEHVNISDLTTVLEAITAIKAQAAACICEAFQLGLLSPGTEQADLQSNAKPHPSILAEGATVPGRGQPADQHVAMSAVPCDSGSDRSDTDSHLQKRNRHVYENGNQQCPKEQFQSSLCMTTATAAVETPALAALAAAAAAAAEHEELLSTSDEAVNSAGPPKKQRVDSSPQSSDVTLIPPAAAGCSSGAGVGGVGGRGEDESLPTNAKGAAAKCTDSAALNRLGSSVSHAESCGGNQPAPAAVGDIKQLVAPRLGAVLARQQDAGTPAPAAGDLCDLGAARALFGRVLAVMSRSQALSKHLAMMVVPYATAVQGLRQQKRGLSEQARKASHAAARASTSLRHEQDNSTQLMQQLEVTKVALAVKQRQLLKLQEELQAATVAQAAQLQKVGQTVNQLLEVTNRQSVQLADKQRLMIITTDILQALL